MLWQVIAWYAMPCLHHLFECTHFFKMTCEWARLQALQDTAVSLIEPQFWWVHFSAWTCQVHTRLFFMSHMVNVPAIFLWSRESRLMGNSTHMTQKVILIFSPSLMFPQIKLVCRDEFLLAGKYLGCRLVSTSGGKWPDQIPQQLNKACGLPAYLGFE